MTAELILMLISVFLTIISAWIIHRITNPKAKIIWGAMHGFTHFIPPLTDDIPNDDGDDKEVITKVGQFYYTNSYLVRNAGRSPAKNIQITLNSIPNHYEIWPPTFKIKEEIVKSGRAFLIIERLNPKEEFTIELLGASPAGDNVYSNPKILGVKSDNANANEINFMFYPQANKLMLTGVFSLMAVGAYIIFSKIIEVVYHYLLSL